MKFTIRIKGKVVDMNIHPHGMTARLNGKVIATFAKDSGETLKDGMARLVRLVVEAHDNDWPCPWCKETSDGLGALHDQCAIEQEQGWNLHFNTTAPRAENGKEK